MNLRKLAAGARRRSSKKPTVRVERFVTRPGDVTITKPPSSTRKTR